MTWLMVPTLAGAALFLATIGRWTGFMSLTSIFFISQLVMLTGSLPYLDADRPADATYATLLGSTLIAYATAATVTYFIRIQPPRPRRDKICWTPSRPRPAVVAWLLVSLLITIAYYLAVGYNVFLLGLTGQLADDANSIATLRLESYAGQRYLYPGYVNQFKNYLAPSLTIVILSWWWLNGIRKPIASSLLIGACVLALLGTGQRGAFAGIIVALFVYLRLLDPMMFARRSMRLAASTLPVFFFATALLSRPAPSGEPSSGLASLANQVASRFLASNQESAVAAFRYIYQLDTTFGREWLTSITGLLPGQPGSDLSNRVFASLYGSMRGTAPPSIWGSMYHNFGLIGSLLIAVALGIGFQIAAMKLQAKRSGSTLELIGIAGAVATLGTWIAGSPTDLINSGLIVFVLLIVWARRYARKTPEGELIFSPSVQAKNPA